MAHGSDGQAGLCAQIRDRGQLRGDLAVLDLLPQLRSELLVGMLEFSYFYYFEALRSQGRER